MTAIDDAFRPWLDCLLEETGPLALFDAHTHIGQNDPDGFKQTPDELVEGLAAADARGVVFPMHEPTGYREANDAVVAAAADNPGRLVAFCRVNPHDGAVAEARRSLDAGARGIKLHPRAEQFGMDAPAVRDIVALAHERHVPILIHAGRGCPPPRRPPRRWPPGSRSARASGTRRRARRPRPAPRPARPASA